MPEFIEQIDRLIADLTASVWSGELVELRSVREKQSAGFGLAVVKRAFDLRNRIVLKLRSIATSDEMFCFADEVRVVTGQSL